MSKVLVSYYSQSGTTEKMAELIVEGMENSDRDVDVDLKEIENVDVDSLTEYDGIVLGSPTYYGQPASEVKDFIDESITHHGDLEGMVGGAFSSSANPAGGNETTIMSILEALLIHGMVIQGTSEGDHYGPVVIDEAGDRERKQCKKYGRDVVDLVARLK
ncbi:flavodoxin [candidate division MSBL1 archaeon SCGC-AAA259E19]|uniref:Flavodoxin n=1 Tax=candidate division MSBL1 archaeon SCGC-AAA259E19 TaxID=1698264 RepID=A0A133UHX6_9EURY|nr:flavodoxin [candidate division MSBL1 archaeon SCGC-AAA259E19]